MVTSTKFTRTSTIPRMTIQGQVYPRSIVQSRFCCFHCLGSLKLQGHGLVCREYGDFHYGFIKKVEAEKITQEERFMQLSDLFKADHFRGIDFSGGPKEMVLKNVVPAIRKTKDGEKDVVWCFFEGEKKKLALTLSNVMGYDHCEKFGIYEELGEPDNWIGKRFTVFGQWEKHGGKKYYCARMKVSKSQPGSKKTGQKAAQAKPQAAPPPQQRPKKEPERNHTDDIYDEVQQKTNNYFSGKSHLYNVIKPWPLPGDEEGRQRIIAQAVQHVSNKVDEKAA